MNKGQAVRTICILSETSDGVDIFNALRAHTSHNLVFAVYRNFEYNRLPHADLFLLVADTIENATALKKQINQWMPHKCVFFVWGGRVAGDVSIFVDGRNILSQPQKIRNLANSLEIHMRVNSEIIGAE